MEIYDNSKDQQSLAQDNKYQFYLAYTYINGDRLWKCKEYKNPTINERCSAYFKDNRGIFLNDFQSSHTKHKFYSIEIQRNKYRQYFKETISNSPNKYSLKPKDVYNKTKEEHPGMKIGYTKCKQVITNYIAARLIPEPNSIADIDLNNVIFKEEDGTPLITILDHSKGLLIMSQSQAHLVAQYQRFYFFWWYF